MKKVLFYFLAIMMGLTFAACGNDDEPKEKPDEIITTDDIDFFSRTIHGNDVAFLNSKGSVVINNTKGTIQLTCKYNDFEGHTHSFTTNVMQVSHIDGATFTFNDPTMTTSYDGSTSSGYLNTVTGVVSFTFSNEIGKVVITTYLSFPSAESRVQRIGDSNYYSHNMSDYLFAPVDQGTKCILQINNFVANTSGVVEADVIQFLGLPMTPTPDGYIIQTDQAESTYGSHCTITDVDITIKSQCRVIEGSFKCNGYNISFTASYH